MSNAPNPYAVTTQEVGKPALEIGGGARAIHWMVIVALPLLIIGSAAAVFDIESIVGSGPVMLTYGLILMFLTSRQNQRRFRWFAWSCCVFPVLVFFIIFALQWSPSDAQTPISSLCCVFAFAMFCGILATFAWSSAPAPWEHREVALTSDMDDSIGGPVGISSPGSPSKAP